MPDRRLDPRGIRPSTTNGDRLVTAGGIVVWESATSALNLLVVSVTNGVPFTVYDADGTPVTEG